MNHKELEIRAKHVFKSALSKVGQIDDSTFDVFFKRTHVISFDKNKFLIEEGQQEDHIYFIIDGAVLVYVLKNKVEHLTNFRFTYQFTCSATSFLTRQPSEYFIKTIVPSHFLAIHYDDLQDLYSNHPQINTLGRLTMEALLVEKRQRELNLLTLGAEERYRSLVETHPQYVLNIKQKHIASFLGITPESLSRIRKKLQLEK